MKYTPDFYQKAFELDALLEKALNEQPDSPGKRRTLSQANRILMKYSQIIQDYLKTSEPQPETRRRVIGESSAKNSWMSDGFQQIQSLRKLI